MSEEQLKILENLKNTFNEKKYKHVKTNVIYTIKDIVVNANTNNYEFFVLYQNDSNKDINYIRSFDNFFEPNRFILI